MGVGDIDEQARLLQPMANDAYDMKYR